MCGAVACFTCLDATAKFLSLYMTTLQVVWARYTGAFLFAFAVSNPLTHPGVMSTRRPVLQIARSTLLLGSTWFNFLALRYLQLDEVMAIAFSTPFYRRGAVRADAGRMGRLAALDRDRGRFRRRAGGDAPGVRRHPSGRACSRSVRRVCYAFYAITTRILARTDSNQTTLFYSNLVGAVAMAPVVWFVWVTPSDPLIIALMLPLRHLGELRALSADRRPSPGAGGGAFAVHLYADRLGGRARLPRVRRRAQPLDAAGAAIVVASGLYILHRERIRVRA